MKHLPAALTVATIALLAGCASDAKPAASTPSATSPTSTTNSPKPAPSPTLTADPKTLAAATKVAKEETARWDANDIAGAWELWTAAGQAAISKADYVRLTHGCHPDGPIPIKVSNVRLESSSHAVARIGLGIIQGAYDVVYENNQWHWRPTKDDMADYKLGWKKALKKLKAENACG